MKTVKPKNLLMPLLVSIIASFVIGVGSAYYFNKIIHLSHDSTYSLENELYLYDEIIEKVKREELEASDLIGIFTSERARRIGAHNVMDSSQEVFYSLVVIWALIITAQTIFLFISMKKWRQQ